MANEDFTTYVEVDGSNRLTVIASRITGVDVDRDIDAYVYKDFDANHFNGINSLFEILQDSATLLYGLGFTVGFTNIVGDATDWESTALSAGWGEALAAPNHRINLFRGAYLAADVYGANEDTLYYLTMERSADSDSATLKIYSDAARTNLLDTLTLSGYGTTTKWRYCYGFSSWNAAQSGMDWDGYIQNLDLQQQVLRNKSPIMANKMMASKLI